MVELPEVRRLLCDMVRGLVVVDEDAQKEEESPVIFLLTVALCPHDLGSPSGVHKRNMTEPDAGIVGLALEVTSVMPSAEMVCHR